MSGYLFTSESVSMGHPDKLSDQVSDGVLDAMLGGDPESRCACETLCTTDYLTLAGEIRTQTEVDFEAVAREVVRDIGYVGGDMGFDAETFTFENRLHEQSADIAQGVDADGAGDQGLMFGYACKQTPELMPLPIALSHRIINRITEARKAGEVSWLRPDAKSQVTVRFDEAGKPVAIDAVVLSTQHAPDVTQSEIKEFVVERVVKPSLPEELAGGSIAYHINPTGNFVIGGPHGDAGLTGRKIIVDTYGGWGRHGGGAFSGKDATKVDRSAAYMARHVAKNVVAAGLAQECEVQLAYAIGVVQPVSVRCDTKGTSELSEEKLVEMIRDYFPLTPRGIIENLDLKKPVFRQTASGGHFGRTGAGLTWEATDKAASLASAAGLEQPVGA